MTTIDIDLEAMVARIAGEQGRQVPKMRRHRSGSFYLGSVIEAADGLGMLASDLVEAAEHLEREGAAR